MARVNDATLVELFTPRESNTFGQEHAERSFLYLINLSKEKAKKKKMKHNSKEKKKIKITASKTEPPVNIC